MRIGFDGKRAVQNFTGLGNYSRYIVDILCQFYPENEYVLYAPKKRENKRLDKLTKQYQQLQLSYPTTSSWKKLSSLWRVWGVTQQLEKEKIDIFHGLSNELPLNIHQSEVKKYCNDSRSDLSALSAVLPFDRQENIHIQIP